MTTKADVSAETLQKLCRQEVSDMRESKWKKKIPAKNTLSSSYDSD